MAKLEGFRLVNVHANHNSIIYPNEYFQIEGKNALLDMKNGGGKTLAAQMLFQTVLPNSYFSDKNPVVNLFAGVSSGSTVHTVSHFSTEGQQFSDLYLGFAAMAEPKNSEDLPDVVDRTDLGLKYMTYIIAGNNLAVDSLSIETLPLCKSEGDTITPSNYKELKDFLQTKMRSDKHGRYFVIQIFENEKTKYYQELKKFGINSEVFEFLREINKDENYIKQFFEEKCKRPRDLLMNFIIPNTEKALDARAFIMQLDKVDRSAQLAESLFEKSQSLNELNKFQADKAEYERLRAEIGAFIDFVNSKSSSLSNYDLHLQEYPKQVAAYLLEIRQVEERLRNFQAQSVDLAGQKEALLKELENVEIRELQIKLDELMKIHSQKEDKLSHINSEIEELTSQRTKMEAINLSIDYKQYEADKNGIDELLDKLTSAHYDEKRITSELANTIYLLSNRVIGNLEEELHSNDSSLKQENEKKGKLQKLEGQLELRLQQNSSTNKSYEEQKYRLESEIAKIQKELSSFPNFSGSIFEEEELKELELVHGRIEKDLKETKDALEKNKEENNYAIKEKEKKETLLEERLSQLKEKEKWLQEYKSSLEDIKKKTSVEEEDIENACDRMRTQVETHAKKYVDLENRIEALKEEIAILEDYGFLRARSKYDALNLLKGDWKYAEFGSEVLKTLSKEKVEIILDRFPGFSEVLVVSDEDYKRVAEGKKSTNVTIARENFVLMPWSTINKISKEMQFEQLYLLTRDGDYYKSLLNPNEAISIRTKEIDKLTKTCEMMESEKLSMNSQIELLSGHLYRYAKDLYHQYLDDAEKINSAISSLKALKLQYEQQIKSTELRADELKAKLEKLGLSKEEAIEKKRLLDEKIGLEVKHSEIRIQIKHLSEEKLELEYEFDNNQADLKISEKEIEKLEKAINRVKQNVSQYKKYIDETKGYKDEQFGLLSEEDITNLFNRFEVAKQKFDEKAQSYAQLVERQSKLSKQMDEIQGDFRFRQFKFVEIYGLHYIEKIRSEEFQAIESKLKELNSIKPEYESDKNTAAANLKLGQKEYEKVEHKITVYFSKFEALGWQELHSIKEECNTELSRITVKLDKNNQSIKELSIDINNYERQLDKFKVFCNSNALDWKNATQAEEKAPYETMYQDFEKLKIEYERAISKVNLEIKKLETTLKNLSINEQVKLKLKDYLINKRTYSEVMQLVSLLEQTSTSINMTIKNLETSIDNIGRLDEEIASQVFRMLKTILDEISKIPEYSKFKYEDYTKESFRINLSDENSCRIENEVALHRIKTYVYELAYSVQNEGMSKKEIKNKLSINSIIQFGVDFDKLNIQILKIEQEKPKYYSWGRLSASSGQSYVTYVMFAITMIKYFNNVTIISDKMKAPIFVFLDNPFASASAIELWEPVRRFLDKSNAQLLCVAHNVPSSAQILFDKHMIIEQTKNSKGQFINTMRNEKTESKEIIQMKLFDHFTID